LNPDFPRRVFGKLPDAAAWMCDGDATPIARQIEEAVRCVRTAVQPPGITHGSVQGAI
jgi:hypothetical protein